MSIIATFSVIFIFGTLIGSFLNVVVYRLHTGLSIVHGRSQCFSCNKKLAWYELVPIFSFLIQKGKCRSCQAPISWQYVSVEALMGVLCVFIAYTLSFSLFAYTSASLALFLFFVFVASLTVVLGVYDLKHSILPFVINLLLLLLSFCYALWQWYVGAFTALDVSTGFLLALPIALLHFCSGGRWIGFADTILFASVGFLLGFVAGVHAFVYAFWIGASVSLVLIKISKKYNFKSEVPFGPFIIIALWITFFMQKDIFGISLLL